MKKIFTICIIITSSYINYSCNNIAKSTTKNNFIELKAKDSMVLYLKNYFKLSEDRNLDVWYNTYLNECNKFYKINNPTKDSIVNLIKSYWLTSNQQQHNIIKMESRKIKKGKEVFITMNYSYTIIATNTKKIIEKLKLYLLLNNRNKVISISEFSRG